MYKIRSDKTSPNKQSSLRNKSRSRKSVYSKAHSTHRYTFNIHYYQTHQVCMLCC
jgi:hypothetical protein